MGDIIFASVSGKNKDQSTKDYDLVLKCSNKVKLYVKILK
jgi:hypothetical protein